MNKMKTIKNWIWILPYSQRRLLREKDLFFLSQSQFRQLKVPNFHKQLVKIPKEYGLFFRPKHPGSYFPKLKKIKNKKRIQKSLRIESCIGPLQLFRSDPKSKQNMQEFEIHIDSFSQPFSPRNYSTETDNRRIEQSKKADIRRISCNKIC